MGYYDTVEGYLYIHTVVVAMKKYDQSERLLGKDVVFYAVSEKVHRTEQWIP